MAANEWYTQENRYCTGTISEAPETEDDPYDDYPPEFDESSSSSEMAEPQDFSEATISYVRDNMGNYDISWIPATPERKKPFVIRIGGEYFLFSYKSRGTGSVSRNVNGAVSNESYTENVITLSRGFANCVFGEQQVCFPKYSVDSLDSVMEGALSFENQSLVQLPSGTWRMYFNALYDDGEKSRFEICKADSDDLENWRDFSKIEVVKDGSQISNVYDPFVTAITDGSGNTAYVMYASMKDDGDDFMTIREFTGEDGVHFSYSRSLYKPMDGFYNARSPYVLDIDTEHRKMFYTIYSGRVGDAISSMIVSLEWDFSINDLRQTSIGGISRLIVEKGYNEGSPFSGNWGENEMHYANPCVIWDMDCGCFVQRMYYNSVDEPWVWHNQSLEKAGNIYGTTIHTDYLEMYEWRRESLQNGLDGYYDNSAHRYKRVVQYAPIAEYASFDAIPWQDPSGSSSSGYYTIPDGYCNPSNSFIKYEWKSSYDKCLALKIRTGACNAMMRSMSQGYWIGYDNVANTSATLYPEYNSDPDYDLDKYSASAYIGSAGLSEKFAEWQSSHPHEQGDFELLAMEFLVDTKEYPQYMWWSRKGPGIYRYIGWNVIKGYKWKGDGE